MKFKTSLEEDKGDNAVKLWPILSIGYENIKILSLEFSKTLTLWRILTICNKSFITISSELILKWVLRNF
jgi:hypothetical protein